MPITVNENGVLYTLTNVYSNENGAIYDLTDVKSNENGALYTIHTKGTYMDLAITSGGGVGSQNNTNTSHEKVAITKGTEFKQEISIGVIPNVNGVPARSYAAKNGSFKPPFACTLNIKEITVSGTGSASVKINNVSKTTGNYSITSNDTVSISMSASGSSSGGGYAFIHFTIS